MTEKALWNEFITKHKINNTDYTAWTFGAEADLLAHLVATGEKTATSSAYQLYETENEPLPKAGDYSVILDSQNNDFPEDAVPDASADACTGHTYCSLIPAKTPYPSAQSPQNH